MSLLAAFSFSFAVAAVLCVYVLPAWAALLLGIVALLTGVIAVAVRGLRDRGIRRIAFGLALGFLWCYGYEMLQLRPLGALDGELRKIHMVAIEDGEPTEYGYRVLCRSGSVGVLAYIDTPNTPILAGEELSLTAELCGVSDKENLYYISKDVGLLAYQEGSLDRTGRNMGLRTLPARIYSALQDRITELFPQDVSPFALALLTGDTSKLSYGFRNQMSLVGISHVVAVSGMHVSLICALVLNLCLRRRRLAALLCLGAMWFFGAMLGFTPSVTRAVVMNSILLMAPIFNREYDSPTALGFALFLLLLKNPYAIGSVGLQLSFASVGGILWFTGPICRWMRHLPVERILKGRFLGGMWNFLTASAATTLGASILTMPLGVYYFGTVSLISVLSNVVLLPLISAIFTLGYPLLLMSYCFYHGAVCIAHWIGYPIRWILSAVECLSRVPYATLYSGSPYVLLWMGASYLLLFMAYRFRRAGVALLLCIAMLITIPVFQSITRESFAFTMVDVGQGQCLIGQWQDYVAVIDCGGSEEEGAGETAARELLNRGKRRLDALILTHFDTDHAGGCVQLMDRIEVGCLYLPNLDPESDQRTRILAKANEEQIPICWVTEDLRLNTHGGRIDIFAPVGTKSENDGLSLLLSVGDYDILVTGDLSVEEERQLLLTRVIPDIEILVAGHHGAADSTGHRLLEYAKPEQLLISVGENYYGHPTSRVLERATSLGIAIRRTDLEGTIRITR